jgi:hypothetical protein
MGKSENQPQMNTDETRIKTEETSATKKHKRHKKEDKELG